MKDRKSAKKIEAVSKEDSLCLPAEDLLNRMKTSWDGLHSHEIQKRMEMYGKNELVKKKKKSALIAFLSYFKSPLLFILLIAGTISGILGQMLDAIIIFSLILLSVILNFSQEHKAGRAADELEKRVANTATVIREGIKKEVKFSDLVPGDVISLSAGDIVPADCRILEAKDLFIDQSALTGESFPIEKDASPLEKYDLAIMTKWNNYLFMGTAVVSGIATAVVVKTGIATEYGEIVKKSIEKRPETEFERGLRRFSFLIMEVILALVLFVFLIQAIYRHDVLESLLFSLALAVGLTPELLPMIMSINLSKGALSMAKKGIIVKRLSSIQNFGSMDVLCTDKTGTLTENRVELVLHINAEGKDDENVFVCSYLNSRFQTGLKSPLDDAILKYEKVDIKKYEKIDEIPFDFFRKKSSVVVSHEGRHMLITKGAPEEILKICSHYDIGGRSSLISDVMKKKIFEEYQDLSRKGFRTLGIAYRRMSLSKSAYKTSDESEMTFLGFVAFMDPPKKTTKESLKMLKKNGIELKILTGDNEIVTKKVCEELDFEIKGIVLGSEIAEMNDDALARVVEKANVFARVTPIQKDRIINALKSNNHVVGFLGDGINDAPSMRMADVAISVNNAVDISKESADIILLHKDLRVLHEGVLEGRKTFANTMKYIMMGISSNFGNMFSVAGASLFLPYLPMLPIQILLNNFLYDASQVTLPSDNIDEESIEKPRRIDAKFIRNFMLFFGPISSLFDFLTFFIMIYVFSATEPMFQTAWFLESLFTQVLIIFVIRTRKTPFFSSRPSKYLVASIAIVLSFALVIVFTPLGEFLKFVPLPAVFLAVLALLVLSYVLLAELLKDWFYRKYAS